MKLIKDILDFVEQRYKAGFQHVNGLVAIPYKDKLVIKGEN
jgi:hypothetical protein